jgi:putative peptide zinc metalloprotease protein
VILKAIHETSHGVACKRYGGPVREMGLLFILFAPLAYVDVTSSWRFRSRWQRIHVAAAGMYSELFMAAIAAIVWANGVSGWLSHLCFNIIIMSSVTTLLFNANPLMKFDGYYILSDLLGIPNLYVNGQQYLHYWARRYVFGIRHALPNCSGVKGMLTRVYGVASFVWRVVICVGLTLAAAALFHGAGIVLACLAVLLWVGLPGLKLMRYLVYGKPGEQPNRLRFLMTTGSSLAACFAILVFVPWPGACVAPAIVDYSPLTVVRAGADGFVSKIEVETGQYVQTGQVLAVLRNRELQNELADLELSIEQSKIRSRQLEQQNELAACQAEVENRQSLLKQLSEKKSQVDHLAVRAPCHGKVIQCDANKLLDSYVHVGDELLSIGDDNKKELRTSIAQNDLDAFSAQLNKTVCVKFPGAAVTQMRLTKLIPRARLTPIHPALAALNGGPLAVKSAESSTDIESSNTYELLTPRFTGIVTPTPNQGREHLAGRVGTVSFRAYHESIGTHIYHEIQNWVLRRLSNNRV